MSRYYNRLGEAISLMKWGKLLENAVYKRVAETTLSDGKWVSTVWLGLDHNCFGGRPHIFETMVFSSKEDLGELDCSRYSTEKEAIKGHKELVKKWRRKIDKSNDY